MPNPYFRFKQFTVFHDRCAMKVTTDGCLFGGWCAQEIQQTNPDAKNLLDIGTGTSLLSLMIAQKNNLCIDAVEISKEAAGQAVENIRSSPWKESISLFETDILAFQPEKKYDFIVSNPPFYENELASRQTAKNQAHHSSHLTFSQLLTVVASLLRKEGFFFLLLPFKRLLQTEALLVQHGLFLHKKILVQQSTRHPYFRVLLMGSKQNAEDVFVSTMAIRDEQQQYTPAFAALLKDYYLYL